MPTPKASLEQQLRAYLLHQRGEPQSALWEALQNEFATPVSLRTITNWIQGFKRMPLDIASLDAPFRWHRMDEHELPWEGGAYILNMWVYAQEIWAEAQGQWPGWTFLGAPRENPWLPSLPTPTVREVRWWWRVRQAAPKLNELGVWLLSWRYVFRELGRDLLGLPTNLDDLDAFLAYKPWVSESHEKSYTRAFQGDRIPVIQRTEPIFHVPERGQRVQDRRKYKGSLLRTIADLSASGLNHLLPQEEPGYPLGSDEDILYTFSQVSLHRPFFHEVEVDAHGVSVGPAASRVHTTANREQEDDQ